MRIVSALFLLPLFLLVGCSQQTPTPSSSPPSQSFPATRIDTRAQVAAEIHAQVVKTGDQSQRQMFSIAFAILDGATSEATALAVKDFAGDQSIQVQALATLPGAQPLKNACQWLTAAADSKAATLRGERPANNYEDCKTKALAEAANADALIPKKPTP